MINIPNILTLIRILLIPVFVILLMDHYLGWALAIFIAAGITDGIDGLIARLTDQRTTLGSYLDPIADKLLLLSGFITLAIMKYVPNWLAVIVITRDVIIFIGVLLLFLMDRKPEIKPTLLSKVNTVFQILAIILVLFSNTVVSMGYLVPTTIWAATATTVLTGLQYTYLGIRMTNETSPAR
jgi:cardiolipin synthase